MQPIFTAEINVDEMMSDGLFQDRGHEDVSLIALGGGIRFTAAKPANLMKFAAALQEAAAELSAQQKVARIQKANANQGSV